jgi:hypothetical protein
MKQIPPRMMQTIQIQATHLKNSGNATSLMAAVSAKQVQVTSCELHAAEKAEIVVFSDVTTCRLITFTDISEISTASIFREHLLSTFFGNAACSDHEGDAVRASETTVNV